MDKLTQQKFKTINRLLLDDHVLVHVDSNKPGVDLPEHLRKSSAVILKLSKLFRGALSVLEDKVVTDLLFDFGYYTCHVPMDAIWGATSDKGKSTIWPESVPEPLLKEMMASSSGLALSASEPPQERQAVSSAPPRERLKKVSHLKRVK